MITWEELEATPLATIGPDAFAYVFWMLQQRPTYKRMYAVMGRAPHDPNTPHFDMICRIAGADRPILVPTSVAEDLIAWDETATPANKQQYQVSDAREGMALRERMIDDIVEAVDQAARGVVDLDTNPPLTIHEPGKPQNRTHFVFWDESFEPWLLPLPEFSTFTTIIDDYVMGSIYRPVSYGGRAPVLVLPAQKTDHPVDVTSAANYRWFHRHMSNDVVFVCSNDARCAVGIPLDRAPSAELREILEDFRYDTVLDDGLHAEVEAELLDKLIDAQPWAIWSAVEAVLRHEAPEGSWEDQRSYKDTLNAIGYASRHRPRSVSAALLRQTVYAALEHDVVIRYMFDEYSSDPRPIDAGLDIDELRRIFEGNPEILDPFRELIADNPPTYVPDLYSGKLFGYSKR